MFGLYLKLDRDLMDDGGAGASAVNRLHMWEALYAFFKSRVSADDDESWEDFSNNVANATRTLALVYADARTRWIRSRIEPGEQCGILAA